MSDLKLLVEQTIRSYDHWSEIVQATMPPIQLSPEVEMVPFEIVNNVRDEVKPDHVVPR